MNSVLLNGDCIAEMRGLPDNCVELVLADIPYGVVNRASSGLRNMDKGVADEIDFSIEDMITEVVRCCSGTAYIFCSTEQVSDIRAGFVHRGMSTRLCIWEKTNPSPMNGQHIWLSSVECCVFAKKSGATFNEHCKSSVWRFPTARGKLHPTMKPVKLMEYLIGVSSNHGDTVMDFTMGSGTTGVACMNTGRNFIGIEKDVGYFNIASNRITGNLK